MAWMKCLTLLLGFYRVGSVRKIWRSFTRNMSSDINWVSVNNISSDTNYHIRVCRQFHNFSSCPVSHSLRHGLLWFDSSQHLLLPGRGYPVQDMQVTAVSCRWCSRDGNPHPCRYPDYVYQIDLMIQVTICLVFAFLTFSVIKWEKLLKEKKWLVYSVSLGSVALIEVMPCLCW